MICDPCPKMDARCDCHGLMALPISFNWLILTPTQTMRGFCSKHLLAGKEQPHWCIEDLRLAKSLETDLYRVSIMTISSNAKCTAESNVSTAQFCRPIHINLHLNVSSVNQSILVRRVLAADVFRELYRLYRIPQLRISQTLHVCHIYAHIDPRNHPN